MVFEFLRGRRDDRLDTVEQHLVQMLAEDRHAFDLAASVLVGGGDHAAVGQDLRKTDQRVNELEREIRRALVVHASVHGTEEVSSLLAYMSVAKDLERVGDYAKNIYDLAAQGADFSQAADRERLNGYRSRVSELIGEASIAFRQRDEERARRLIEEGDQLQDTFDATIEAFIRSDEPAREAVPRALFYRHLKRIVAHLMNLLSAVVMPLDRLDYYDEDRDGRR